MSVCVSDLVIYGSANMPDADGVTTGGAVSFAKRLSFTDISPAGLMDYVSSSASDTATTITLSYLDASGVAGTEAVVLTGQTLANGAASMERVLKGVVTGTAALGDVAALSHTAIVTGTAQAGAAATTALPARLRLAAGHGGSVSVGQIIRITNNSPAGVQYQLRQIVGIGTDVDPSASVDDVYVSRDWGTVPSVASTYSVHEGMLFELSPNQVTEIRRPFYGVIADPVGGSSQTLYEKVFAVNNNTVTTLTAATLAIFSETPALPSGALLDIAVCKALNDTKTTANRQTLPTNADTTALTFTTGAPPQTQSVPSPGQLPAGAAPNSAGAQGIWLRLTLPAGTLPHKGAAVLRTQGATT